MLSECSWKVSAFNDSSGFNHFMSIGFFFAGTPKHINYEKVKRDLISVPGVRNAHSLHIWSLTLNKTALAAHLVLGIILLIPVLLERPMQLYNAEVLEWCRSLQVAWQGMMWYM